jgi:hypothetical protein
MTVMGTLLKAIGFGGGRYILRQADGKIFELQPGNSWVSKDGEMLERGLADDITWDEHEGYELLDQLPTTPRVLVGDIAEVATVS